ncbi:MAG: hypothetical protein H6726_02925 [Sandaracinaceae bacterium]|nr:hypothetical protein [Myxococcales bacterium]MCB9656578.1 hypothetical protein [Sandaracinaceae bacterium]
MFNDFDQDAEKEEGRGRRAASMAISGLLFLLIGSGLAATMATVRAMQPRRPDRDVEFADLPMEAPPEPEEAPPPPPPPPPPVRRAEDRPAGERPVLDGPPSEIPDERPEEAEGELAAVNNVGPIENGAVMGEGGGEREPTPPPVQAPRVELPQRVERAPEQERETIRRARFLADQSGCRSLIIPDAVGQALGARTVRIRVRALVGVDGHVMNASVMNGDADVPESLVIDCATQWVFAPATLPDGTAVPYPAIRTFVITPRT